MSRAEEIYMMLFMGTIVLAITGMWILFIVVVQLNMGW